jgi:hypothetical protein
LLLAIQALEDEENRESLWSFHFSGDRQQFYLGAKHVSPLLLSFISLKLKLFVVKSTSKNEIYSSRRFESKTCFS